MSESAGKVEVFDMDDMTVVATAVHTRTPASIDDIDRLESTEPQEPVEEKKVVAPATEASAAEAGSDKPATDEPEGLEVVDLQPVSEPVKAAEADSLDDDMFITVSPAAAAVHDNPDDLVPNIVEQRPEGTPIASPGIADEPDVDVAQPTAFVATDAFSEQIRAQADKTTESASTPQPPEPHADTGAGVSDNAQPSTSAQPDEPSIHSFKTGGARFGGGENAAGANIGGTPAPDDNAPQGSRFEGGDEVRSTRRPAPGSDASGEQLSPEEQQAREQAQAQALHDQQVQQAQQQGKPRGGGGGGAGGALGILAAGLVAGTGALTRGGAGLLKGTAKTGAALATGAASAVKDSSYVVNRQANRDSRNQEAASLRQMSQANEFLDRCDAERAGVDASIRSMNTRIEAMPAGQTYIKGLGDYSNNIANATGVSRGAARQAAVERIHDLSDTSDPVINSLRELGNKVAADPEVDEHARAARRGMTRMERASTSAAESLKSGMENMPDGPRKQELSEGFEDRADKIANTAVENAHLSKPGSTGKERLEEAASSIRKSMEEFMEKIKEMVQNLLRAIGIGRRP